MRGKRTLALLALLLAMGGAVAGCASNPAPATPASTAITCTTVVDATGQQGGPLTPHLAIRSLAAMLRGGGEARIHRGRPDGADASTLDVMAVELMGHRGNKLSADAQDFAQAELNYNPDGPVETAYARPLDDDIRALQRDCPA